MPRKIFFIQLQPLNITCDFNFKNNHLATKKSVTAQKPNLKGIILSFIAALLITSSYSSIAELHGTLTTTSNYVYRGYSKSYDKFALQANIDYEVEAGGYVGASASTVDFDDKEDFDNTSQVEIAPYLGWSYGLSDDWRLDLRYTRYLYDANIFGKKSDFNEYYLFLHYRDLLSANISFSEDYYNRGKSAQIYELIGRYPLTDYFQISSGVGYSQTKKTLEHDYLYWNAGLIVSYKFASFDFRYVDATEIATNQGYLSSSQFAYVPEVLKPSFVFTISLGF
jgi:uncharacterized protein (TIGR02001 family)